MSWANVVVGVASLAGGALAARGADKAADAIGEGTDQAAAFQNRALDTSVALARPRLEVGNSALGVLADLFGLAPPSQLDFDNLGGGNRGGPIGGSASTEGLSPIPGATWQNRPVFTDGQGGIYSVRGRDGTLENNGLSYLGQATEGNGLRFEGKAIKTGNGTVLDFRGGQFFRGRGQRAAPIEVEPIAQTAAPDPNAQTPSAGLNLNDLVANNPLIQFNREQGELAIDRGAAARGLNQSGGTLQDLSRFNQQLSSTGIQQFVLNPLFEIAGFGERASTRLDNSVQSTNQTLGNLALGKADARGSAFQNAGNIFGNTVSDIAGSFATRNRNTRVNNPNSPFLFNANTGQELQGPPRG